MSEYFTKDTHLFIYNALAYIFTLIYFYKRNKRSVGTFIWLIYTISAFFAIFYYGIYSMLDADAKDLSIWGFVYLYICLMIGLLPLVKMKEVKEVSIGNMEYSLFIVICYVVILLSLEPLFENILLTFKPHDAQELHDDAAAGDLKIYSALGERLNQYCTLFRSFVPFATILAFKIKRMPVLIKYGLLCPSINFILTGYNYGMRGTIVCYFMMVICVFIFLFPLFTKLQRRYVKRITIFVGGLLLFLFMAISVSRMEGNSSSDTTLGVWIMRYTAEGPVLFNSEIWEKTPKTNGDVNFNFYKKQLGLKTFITYKDREEHYLAKNGMRIEVFRTYVGDFLTDMGYWGTFLFCCMITFFVVRFYHKGKMTIASMLLYSNVFQLYGIGFASNLYRDYSMAKSFFVMMMLMCIFGIIRQSSREYILVRR
ncbi:MAG: oligosaccharide repeat unit polymerase [Bacteroidaceae bacterium]|nr:oligosaccharide repeat unit polymerase [Bacteroidaceae bacterium]